LGRVGAEGAQHTGAIGPGHDSDRRGLDEPAAPQPPVRVFGSLDRRGFRLAAQPVAKAVGAGVHDLPGRWCLPQEQLVVLGVRFLGDVSTAGVDPQPVVAGPGRGDAAEGRLVECRTDDRGTSDGGPPADLDDVLPSIRDSGWRPVQDAQNDLDMAGVQAATDHRTARHDRDQPVAGKVDLRNLRTLQQRQPVTRDRRQSVYLLRQDVLRPGARKQRSGVARGHRGLPQQQGGGPDRDTEHGRGLRGPIPGTHPRQRDGRRGRRQRQVYRTVLGGDVGLIGDVGTGGQLGSHPRVAGQAAGQRGDQRDRPRPDLLQQTDAGGRLVLLTHAHEAEGAAARLTQQAAQVGNAGQIELGHRQLQCAE
jgi:hypothetical protein